MKATKTNSSLFYSIGLCLLMGIVLMSESRAQQTLVCPKNIDFELGNLSIWKPFTGSCCPIVANTAGAVTGRHTIVTGAGTDPFGGFPIVPAGGGLYALKLGNSGTGAQAEKARYHVRIPTGVNNYSLIYRYAVVFQDPGHTTAQQPRFEVKTFDSATNQSISCNTHTYIAASNIPGFTQSTVNTSVYYKSWSTATINLSGYAGKTVIIDFASGDCSLGGHFGYGYVDLSCGLFQISTVACKKQPTSTMSAPPGFQSYQWLDSTKSNVLGTSSTLVVNTPTKKTRYYVVLTPYTGFGCPDTLSTTITVTDVVANYNIAPTSKQCFKGNAFTFANTSTTNSTPLTYAWSFGDGNTSTLTSPSKSYLLADSFKVRLIASTPEGCKDTISKYVTVYPSPQMGFSINDSDQCFKNHNFIFTNTTSLASGSKTNYWTFGDGTNSSDTSPSKTYSTYGNYTVKLKIISDKGCSDSISKLVLVYAMPKAKFSVNDSDQCFKNHNFIFTNNSSIPVGSNTYNWHFGDGSTSTVSSPSKTYATADSFMVRLIATSNNNCNDTAFKPVVTYAQPLANFSINDSDQCFRGHQFVFTNSSTLSKGSKTNYWTFGDGTSSSQNNPSKTYSTYGNYTVKLKVISDKGCSDSISKLVLVYAMPKAKFSVNDSDQCFKNHNFIFTNNSSIPVGSNTYNWHFGDGSTSTVSSPSKTYATADSFIVRLIATSNNNCQDTAFKPVVTYAQPLANFSINDSDQCFRGHQFVFTNSSSISKGSKTNYWTFGDGTSSSQNNPSKTYSTYGNYTVKLKVISDKGCSDSISKLVLVYAMPKAKFTVNDSDQCFKGHKFIFTNNTSIPVGTSTYVWQFGDSSTSNLVSPSKQYAYSNTFNIKLIAVSDHNCTDTTSKIVYVYSMPKANFLRSDTGKCLKGNQFVFTNTSTPNNAVSSKWTFGDGFGTTIKSPSHSYASIGVFTVKLIVGGNAACSDTVQKTVEVYPMPKARFTMNDSTQCLRGNQVNFINQSSIAYNSLNYLWRFGNGDSSVQNNAIYTYPNYGVYTAKLIAISQYACRDTTSRPIEIYPMPKANFTLSDTAMCLRNNRFTFTNSSSIPYNTFTYQWLLSNGTTSTSNAVNYSYGNYGVYQVRLIAISNKGCVDTIRKMVEVYPTPKARFTMNDSTQCVRGNQVNFINQSSIVYNSLSYLWRLGNGDSSSQTNTSQVYSNYGMYNVKLIVISQHGCRDTTSKPIEIYPMPKANFTMQDTAMCLRNNVFAFNNSSSISYNNLTYQWQFGDGAISNLSSSTHSYSNYGIYQVKLIANSNKGCSDTITKKLEVYPMPKAHFTMNDSTQCLNGNQVNYINQSSIVYNSLSYLWRLGNGDSSNQTNANQVYANFGVYTPKLIAISQHGCRDTTIKPVEIYPMPKASFTILDTALCLRNNRFTFTNNSSIPYNTLSYQWQFGDGGSSGLTSVNYTYGNYGVFQVRLVANSNKGCTDTIRKMVEVYPMPKAQILIPDSAMCLLGNQFQFNNASSIPYHTLSYEWRFGDGASANTINSSHKYSTHGWYTVSLIAKSAMNCRDTMQRLIEVYPMPHAQFRLADTARCFLYNQFAMFNQSSLPYGTLNYKWLFGDNDSIFANNPIHSYNAIGAYSIVLIASSNHACKDTVRHKAIVYASPKIQYTINQNQACLRGNRFVLQDKTVHLSKIKSWNWTFFNTNANTNQTITTPNAAISFNQIGKYYYRLILTDTFMCADTIMSSVNVYPQTRIQFTTDTVCFGFKNQYASQCSIDTGVITQIKWHFGDGQTALATACNHQYAAPGQYNVMLTTINEFNCKDTLLKMQSAMARQLPVAGFNYAKILDSLTCTGYQLTSTSQGQSVLTHAWDFNGIGSSSLANPYVLFTDSGLKWIQLKVTDQYGCTDKTAQWIKASPETQIFIPNAFTPNRDKTNDLFKPFGVVYPRAYEWLIVNRWGEILFQSNDYLEGWDGTYKGERVPDGVYAYQLKVTTLQNKKLIFSGTVHVLY